MLEVGMILFFPLFVAGIAIIAIYLLVTWRIERHLEIRHPAKWLELGSPHLLYNNSFRTSKQLYGFLAGPDSVAVDDAKLAVYIRRWKRLRVAAVVVFLSGALALLFDVILAQ